MKKHLFFAFSLLSGFLSAQITYPSLNMTKIGFIDPETVMGVDNIKYSGCWGWDQTSKNKAYAIVGSSTGTYFIDITAPATPTVCDYVKGKHTSPCIWREIQTYQNFAYVVSDDGAPNSFQIIDMQYLPDSVHVVYDGKSYFERAHQLYVAGNKLYVAGITFSNSATANMRVYSLATPTAPALLRTLSQDYPSISYVHDMYVRTDTVFAHCGNQGLYVYKFTSGNTFSVLGSLTGYADAGYNHSSSLTKDGKTLIFCDEVPTGLRIKSADVSNLSNISVSALFRPNTNSQFVGHNPYVVGNKYAFISCYEDGLNLYDISSPSSPTLIAYFDTYPQGGANFGNNYGSGSYNGNWGAYPYFKSGLILACDMQNGIFILGANAFAPSANFNFASGICAGALTSFTNTSTNNPVTYNWNIAGVSPSSYTVANPAITFTAAGIYNATLVVSNASGTNSVVKSITVSSTPTISVNNSTICSGNTASISASGAGSYSWSTGATTSQIVVSPSVNTVYTVTGSNGACANTKTVSVTIGTSPTVNVVSSTSMICSGQSVTLTASGASTYTWMPGNITGNPIAPSPTLSTTYSVTGASAASCSKTSTLMVSVSACTGLGALNGPENDLVIIPNPNDGKFKLFSGNEMDFDLTVYDNLGRIIMESPNNKKELDVDLSSFKRGMYLIIVRTGTTYQKLKVITE
jgi:choice-of-anchor B domain-containing protein